MTAYQTQLSGKIKNFYEDNPVVKEWFDKFSRFKSPRTAEDYLGNLQQFVEVVGRKPSELLKLRPETIYDLMLDWSYRKIKEGVAEGTMARRWFGPLSFFKFFDIDNVVVRGKREIPFTKKNRKYLDIIPSRSELKTIFTATLQLPTLIAEHFMAYGGIRPEDVCELTYSSIKEDFEKGVVPCSVWMQRGKTKTQYVTFIPEPTVQLLKKYFEKRQAEGEKFNDSTPIIRDHHTKGTVKPIRRKTLTSKIETAFKRSRLPLTQNKGKIMKHMRPYSLVKYFRSRLSTHVDPEYLEFWMGHSSLKQTYSGQGDLDSGVIEEMRKAYLNAQNHLIAGEEETSKKIEEFHERIKELEKQARFFENISHILIQGKLTTTLEKAKGELIEAIKRGEKPKDYIQRQVEAEWKRNWLLMESIAADLSEGPPDGGGATVQRPICPRGITVEQLTNPHGVIIERLINPDELEEYVIKGWRLKKPIDRYRCIVEKKVKL